MNSDEFARERQFREAWESVEIVRPVHYSLFTFGQSNLPYFLVCGQSTPGTAVTVTHGEVRVDRPLILTPDDVSPEFRNFFETAEEQGVAQFLLARSARFSNLKFDNQRVSRRVADEGMEPTVDKLNRQLDDEEEDRVAILTAPPNLAGVAVLRYATQRVWESSSDNIQELRERGFLP